MGCHAAPGKPSLAVPVIAVAGGVASVPAAVLVTGLAAAMTALAAVFLGALVTGGAALFRARLRYLLWIGISAFFAITAVDDIFRFRSPRWLPVAAAGVSAACAGLWLIDHYHRKLRQERAKLEAQQQWQDSGGRMTPVTAGDVSTAANSNSLPARLGRVEERLDRFDAASRAYAQWKAEQEAKTDAVAGVVAEAYAQEGLEPPDALKPSAKTLPLPAVFLAAVDGKRVDDHQVGA